MPNIRIHRWITNPKGAEAYKIVGIAMREDESAQMLFEEFGELWSADPEKLKEEGAQGKFNISLLPFAWFFDKEWKSLSNTFVKG